MRRTWKVAQTLQGPKTRSSESLRWVDVCFPISLLLGAVLHMMMCRGCPVMTARSLGLDTEGLGIEFMESDEVCGHNEGFSHKDDGQKNKIMEKERTSSHRKDGSNLPCASVGRFSVGGDVAHRNEIDPFQQLTSVCQGILRYFRIISITVLSAPTWFTQSVWKDLSSSS
ncbi:hypothetical protein B0J18DRAFT_223836 [Chaetomium sp. MPI-SDFR-AT-0129]|nr:hypothetical protein B0J18DRAFT_223836 [Chaetomium sp. MPI-SDFR-AT-0129]